MWCGLSFFIKAGVDIVTNEELLILNFQNGDEVAFEKLVDCLLPIIRSVIKKYGKYAFELGINSQKHSKGVLNELEQECVICLFKICKTYKFDKENIITYFYVCCKHTIINYIWQTRNRTSKLYNKNCVFPQQVSFDSHIFNDSETSLSDLISDESSQDDFDRITDKIDNEILLKDIIQLLKETFKCDNKGKIIRMLYGIGEPRKPMKEICEMLNMSSFEVNKEEKRALNIIRHYPGCSWFMKKYAPDYYINSLERIEQINDPIQSTIVKDIIQERLKIIFREIEGI